MLTSYFIAYLKSDKLRQVIYSEDKLLLAKLIVQVAIYSDIVNQVKHKVFYHYILSLFTYISSHTLRCRKLKYRLLVTVGYATARFLQIGKQTLQELPALYKLVGSFQQKHLVWNLIVTKTCNKRKRKKYHFLYTQDLLINQRRAGQLRRLKALVVLILNY